MASDSDDQISNGPTHGGEWKWWLLLICVVLLIGYLFGVVFGEPRFNWPW